MRFGIALAALLAVAPMAAFAQEGRPGLFIAPWGEPVRAQEDQTAIAVWFAATDADQDGRLTLEEFQVKAAAFHAALDRNRDGIVTSAESNTLFRATAPEMFAPPPGPRPTARMPRDPGRLTQPREREVSGPGLRGAARFGLLTEIEPVMTCDADMSRWVNRDEFTACIERRFRLLDANGDGVFELSESPRAAELLRGEEDEG